MVKIPKEIDAKNLNTLFVSMFNEEMKYWWCLDLCIPSVFNLICWAPICCIACAWLLLLNCDLTDLSLNRVFFFCHSNACFYTLKNIKQNKIYKNCKKNRTIEKWFLKGTLCIKKYPENLTFLIQNILELFTSKVSKIFVYKHTETIDYVKE